MLTHQLQEQLSGTFHCRAKLFPFTLKTNSSLCIISPMSSVFCFDSHSPRKWASHLADRPFWGLYLKGHKASQFYILYFCMIYQPFNSVSILSKYFLSCVWNNVCILCLIERGGWHMSILRVLQRSSAAFTSPCFIEGTGTGVSEPILTNFPCIILLFKPARSPSQTLM